MRKLLKRGWIILFGMLYFIPFSAAAYDGLQLDKMTRVIDKYSGSKYAECVDISPVLLKQLSGARNTDKLVKNISGFKILVLGKKDRDARIIADAFEREAKNALKNEYSRLMNVSSDGNTVSIYMEDSSRQIIMLVDSEDEYSLIAIDGNITGEIIKAIMDGDIKIK